MDAAESSNTPAVAVRAPSADDPQSDAQANALQAALISQAESAIYGQFENEDNMPPVERRASRATIRQNAPKMK